MNEVHAKEMGRAARGATRMPDPDAMVGKAVNDRAGSHAAHLSAQNSAISAVSDHDDDSRVREAQAAVAEAIAVGLRDSTASVA